MCPARDFGQYTRYTPPPRRPEMGLHLEEKKTQATPLDALEIGFNPPQIRTHLRLRRCLQNLAYGVAGKDIERRCARWWRLRCGCTRVTVNL